jgi:hypothetical protein
MRADASLAELIRVVSADPVFDVFPQPHGHLAAGIGFVLRDQPVVVVSADVSLSAQFIQCRDDLPLRVYRKFQSLDRAVVLGIASAYAVSRST